MQALKSLNLALSFFLELAALVAFSYAGFHTGKSATLHWLLGLGVPAVVIVFWGKYMAPNAGDRFSDPVRLLVALVLFELAASALYKVHQPKAGLILAGATGINIVLAYIWKQ